MKNLKNILIFVVILAAAGAAYFLFFGKTDAPPATAPKTALETSTGAAPTSSIINQTPLTGAEATRISQEFVNQLLNLQAIKLNDDILSSLAFQSLQDFSITLVQPGNEGRPNPFAPFGADGTEPNTSSSTPSGVIVPGDSATAWSTVKLGNIDIFYPSTWTSVAIAGAASGSAQPPTVGYTFTLPSGVSISWGGPQSVCSSSSYPAFQYGVSTITCIRNTTVQINGSTPAPEIKIAFGDFIQKNK
jgi:hypothetical protein